jgi:hypothetical protein
MGNKNAKNVQLVVFYLLLILEMIYKLSLEECKVVRKAIWK